MKKFHRGWKGFTLIELAIVLVIIGIIIGAVLKGQDLIANARAKRFINDVKEWEMAAWTFNDRKGRFPGDGGDRNGIIGNDASEVQAATNGGAEINGAGFINTPSNPITVGSLNFYVFLGHDVPSAVTDDYNVLVICKTVDCVAGTFFTADERIYIESLDSSLDNVADATDGNVRAATAVTLAPGSPTAANTAAVTVVTEDPSAAGEEWDTTEDLALVYYFDRSYP